MLVRWVKPLERAVKLNIDGSSRGNPGNSGCGGLLRDSNGDWIMGFVNFIGSTGSLVAELIAIRQGLCLAWELGYKKVECESDCLVALQILGSEERDFDTFLVASIVDEIDDLINREWEVTIRHVHREANSCADFLAKIGSSANVRLALLTHPPNDMSPLLLTDSKGVCYSRQ